MSTPVYIILVILIYGTLLAGIVYFAIKWTRLFIIVLGIAAVLAAAPVGYLAEIGINGCCGTSSTGQVGRGYVLGALLGLIGLSLIIINGKFRKK